MPPLPCCQPIRWLIAMHRNEKTLTVTHKCAARCDAHSPNLTPMHVFFPTMTDRAHRCQRWHSLSLLLDVCVRALHFWQWLTVCEQALCVYLYHFLSEIMHMCVFIHMHVPVSITVFVSMPVSSSLPSRFTNRINISLYVCCGDGTDLS